MIPVSPQSSPVCHFAIVQGKHSELAYSVPSGRQAVSFQCSSFRALGGIHFSPGPHHAVAAHLVTWDLASVCPLDTDTRHSTRLDSPLDSILCLLTVPDRLQIASEKSNFSSSFRLYYYFPSHASQQRFYITVNNFTGYLPPTPTIRATLSVPEVQQDISKEQGDGIKSEGSNRFPGFRWLCSPRIHRQHHPTASKRPD